MGVSLNQLVLDERSTMVDVGSKAVRVTYAPQRFNVELEQTRLGGMGYIDILCALVISWDLEGTDGKKLPLEPSAMRLWPGPIWQILGDAIVAEIREGKAFFGNGDDS